VSDWDPARYAAFRALRLRPALDLLAQVPDLPSGAVIDLGCGDGAVASDLVLRFPGRSIVGVDASAAMLEKARETGLYRGLTQADIALWGAHSPAALIFSNAALQWVGDHAQLMPRLAAMLVRGGVLAVQMPRQHAAPSHRLLHAVAAQLWPGRFDPDIPSPVAEPPVYHAMLAPFGDVSIWETEYLQALDPVTEGHPVRAFTESTAARPVLGRLSADEQHDFLAAYDAALAEAYPALPDGRYLFSFRRLFLVFRRAP
jgi:trans-aconitate 2-methyltransferase